jgi:hypothetical protein
MAQIYRVIDLINEPDGHGSFEVGNAYTTSDRVEIDEPTLENVVKAMKALGRMKRQHQTRHFELAEQDDADNLTIRRKRDGYWFYELRPEASSPI